MTTQAIAADIAMPTEGPSFTANMGGNELKLAFVGVNYSFGDNWNTDCGMAELKTMLEGCVDLAEFTSTVAFLTVPMNETIGATKLLQILEQVNVMPPWKTSKKTPCGQPQQTHQTRLWPSFRYTI